MDLQDDSLTRSKRGSPEDRLPHDDLPPADPTHPMEAPDVLERHAKNVSDYRYELEIQADNRREMAIDEDYYDHIQMTPEMVREMEERGQAPVVYDVIHNTVNWVLGTEKRGRTDFKILPRTKEDAKPAEGKTKYLKYLSDVNHTPFNRSRSFEDEVKVGIGWICTGTDDNDDEEPTGDSYVSWRDMLWDSASTNMDTQDMRFQSRSKWFDEDVAIAMFPDRKDAIRASVSSATTFGTSAMLDGDEAMDFAEDARETVGGVNPVHLHKRRRVRIIEHWYRVPAEVQKIRGKSPFKGDVFDPQDPRHVEAHANGEIELVKKVIMQVRVMFMTTAYPLLDVVSPFKHNRLRFVPMWGYRRGRDNLPYGLIRGLRSIQDSINKRASKAVHILSSAKTFVEEDTLSDGFSMEDFVDEIARPDAVIPIKKNRMAGILANVDRGMEAPHLEMMSRDIGMIQQVGGVTDELLGKTTNASSGVAVQARQEQGSLTTSKFFDNLRFAAQLHGEITLSLVEQFVSEEKEFRITNQRGTPEFIRVNDGLPENDITRSKADFVISEADWRATMRQAALDQLMEMMVKMPPEVALLMLDLVVELMDIDNRDEIVKRIRAVNGQRDPDATELTPEEQANQEAKAQSDALAQQQVQLQMEEQAANVKLTKAKAAREEAAINLAKAQTLSANMTGAQLAMTAATSVITMPTIAKVADGLMLAGGWEGGQPVPTNLPAAQGLPQQMQPAPAPQIPPAAPDVQPPQ